MDVTRAITSHIGSASFAFLTSSDIRALSVKRIVNPVSTHARFSDGSEQPSDTLYARRYCWTTPTYQRQVDCTMLRWDR